MRYQIRCVCGHLSAFEIIPMPVVPSHRDMKISDEPQHIDKLEEDNTELKSENEALLKDIQEWRRVCGELKVENEAWRRCADAFNEAVAGVKIGQLAGGCEAQLGEAFRQYALLADTQKSE